MICLTQRIFFTSAVRETITDQDLQLQWCLIHILCSHCLKLTLEPAFRWAYGCNVWKHLRMPTQPKCLLLKLILLLLIICLENVAVSTLHCRWQSLTWPPNPTSSQKKVESCLWKGDQLSVVIKCVLAVYRKKKISNKLLVETWAVRGFCSAENRSNREHSCFIWNYIMFFIVAVLNSRLGSTWAQFLILFCVI